MLSVRECFRSPQHVDNLQPFCELFARTAVSFQQQHKSKGPDKDFDDTFRYILAGDFIARGYVLMG
jgi:hypothetical protein